MTAPIPHDASASCRRAWAAAAGSRSAGVAVRSRCRARTRRPAARRRPGRRRGRARRRCGAAPRGTHRRRRTRSAPPHRPGRAGRAGSCGTPRRAARPGRVAAGGRGVHAVRVPLPRRAPDAGEDGRAARDPLVPAPARRRRAQHGDRVPRQRGALACVPAVRGHRPGRTGHGCGGRDRRGSHVRWSACRPGEKVTNPKHERRDRKRLALAQRHHARKAKGSANREKARRRVGPRSRPDHRPPTADATTCTSSRLDSSARTKRS